MSLKAKEAIKIGLAMVLAYGVGMSQGWMNPVWAAIAVAMISLPTAGRGALEDISSKLVATQCARMSNFRVLMMGTGNADKDDYVAKLESGHEQEAPC